MLKHDNRLLKDPVGWADNWFEIVLHQAEKQGIELPLNEEARTIAYNALEEHVQNALDDLDDGNEVVMNPVYVLFMVYINLLPTHDAKLWRKFLSDHWPDDDWVIFGKSSTLRVWCYKYYLSPDTQHAICKARGIPRWEL